VTVGLVAERGVAGSARTTSTPSIDGASDASFGTASVTP
jgi:hypothetical protein